jgi:MtN3 and saliva related transmembrane protein
MVIISLIGYTAAFCSTFALLPQVIKVWKTKETDQLSAGTFTMMLAGAILWLLYGILREDIIIMMANSVALFFIGFISYIKLMNNKTS